MTTTTNEREQLIRLGLIRPTRFHVVERGNYAVLDTETGTIVERNQYRQDAEYIARRCNAGLSYVPGGHLGEPKQYPPQEQTR